MKLKFIDYKIPPLIQTLDEIRREFGRQVFLKAIDNNDREEKGEGKAAATIVGSVRAYTENKTAFIGGLMVEPKLQNYGIGTLLMKTIEQYFAQEVKRYELFTGHKSIGNLHLYQKLGYQEFKRIPVNNALTMVFMEKYASK